MIPDSDDEDNGLAQTANSVPLSGERTPEFTETEPEVSTDTEAEEFFVDPRLGPHNYYQKKFPEFFPGTDENMALPDELRGLTTEEHINRLVAAYIEGICWCLKYYFDGVPSWRWHFPYRFAPLASSVKGISALTFNFELGRPFRPLEQLLGVLPSRSGKLLPEPYRLLMTSDASPVKDFYPENFEIDMDGKHNPWEGIALIPFIDEKRLLDSVAALGANALSVAELKRNTIAEDDLLYRYDPSINTRFNPSPYVSNSFPGFDNCMSSCTPFKLPPIPPVPEWADPLLKQQVSIFYSTIYMIIHCIFIRMYCMYVVYSVLYSIILSL